MFLATAFMALISRQRGSPISIKLTPKSLHGKVDTVLYAIS